MKLATLLFCRFMYSALTVAMVADRGIDRAVAATKRVTRRFRNGI